MNFFTGWSKKLVAFLIYVGVLLLNKKLELGLSDNDLLALTGGLGAYTVGQGIADLGKEAEKERARTLKSNGIGT